MSTCISLKEGHNSFNSSWCLRILNDELQRVTLRSWGRKWIRRRILALMVSTPSLFMRALIFFQLAVPLNDIQHFRVESVSCITQKRNTFLAGNIFVDLAGVHNHSDDVSQDFSDKCRMKVRKRMCSSGIQESLVWHWTEGYQAIRVPSLYIRRNKLKDSKILGSPWIKAIWKWWASVIDEPTTTLSSKIRLNGRRWRVIVVTNIGMYLRWLRKICFSAMEYGSRHWCEHHVNRCGYKPLPSGRRNHCSDVFDEFLTTASSHVPCQRLHVTNGVCKALDILFPVIGTVAERLVSGHSVVAMEQME